MNQKLLSEMTMVKVERGVRMDLKILAAVSGKTMSEYLKEIINQKKNESRKK